MKHNHRRRVAASGLCTPGRTLVAFPHTAQARVGDRRRQAPRGLFAGATLLCAATAFGAAAFIHPQPGRTAATLSPAAPKAHVSAAGGTAWSTPAAAGDRVTWAQGQPPVVPAGREVALFLRVTTPDGRAAQVPVRVRMVDVLKPTGDLAELARPLGGGLYRVTESFPAGGPWFALVRIGQGSASAVQALPLTVVSGSGVPWRIVLPGSVAAVLAAVALLWLISRTPGPSGTRS